MDFRQSYKAILPRDEDAVENQLHWSLAEISVNQNQFAQFIAVCSSLKHLINGWKHFCRAIAECVHVIEV